jgi:hypothetical protein
MSMELSSLTHLPSLGCIKYYWSSTNSLQTPELKLQHLKLLDLKPVHINIQTKNVDVLLHGTRKESKLTYILK